MKIECLEWAMSSSRGRIMHLVVHGDPHYRPVCGTQGYMFKRVLDLEGEALNRTSRVPMCTKCEKIFNDDR